MDATLSADEIIKLKKDMDIVKRQQGIEDSNEDRLQTSMMGLSRSINSLLKIFHEATEELKMDTHDAVLVGEKLNKIVERLDKVVVQNEKIAKGLVAIADMIEELQVMKRQPVMQSKPVIPPSGQPQKWPHQSPPKQDDQKRKFLNIIF